MIDISVIVPVYGVEKFIERALRSLFTQSKTTGVEFILVDDCSPDSSMEIAHRVIAEFANLDIKTIAQPKNRGLAAARQRGMEAAQGKYVLHIDSDDWCEQQMIEQMHNAAVENDADIVIADFFIDYQERSVYSHQKVGVNGIECAKDILENYLHGSVWSKLYRRSIFVDNDLKWIEGINLWEDLLISTKFLCYADKVVHIPQAYVHYIQNEGSICSVASPAKLQNVIDTISELDKFFNERGFIESVREAFTHKILHTKYFLLRHCAKEHRRNYAKMYSEYNQYIMGMKNLTLDRRLALRAASNGCLCTFGALTNLRNCMRSVLKRKNSRV